MNKLEANASLLIITFFAAIQYAFLTGVPAEVSQFAFLCITNLVGFLIMLAFFFGELFRLDRKQVLQSMLLSAELLGANTLILLGSAEVGATVIACVTSAYFVLIPLFSFVLFKEKPDTSTFPGIAIVLAGLFLMMNADVHGLMSRGVLYLIGADIFITLYFLTLSRYAASSNPSIIAMGQMFFSFLFALAFWGAESVIRHTPLSVPTEPAFWAAVIFISFFIRGLYGIVQIYAMRYVTPLNAALIFSSEIVMTLAMSPVLTALFGMEEEQITPLRAIGAVVMVAGILLADSSVYEVVKRNLKEPKDYRLFLRALLGSAVLYFAFDVMVQATGFLSFGPIVGLKNFLPVTLGIFWGPWSAVGCCIGCAIAGALLGSGTAWIAAECVCTLILGVGMWLLLPVFSKQMELRLKTPREYGLYLALLGALSLLAGLAAIAFLGQGMFFAVAGAYFFLGAFVGIPINVLLSSLLRVESVHRGGAVKSDVSFALDGGPESLSQANEQIEDYCMAQRLGMKKTFEVENCVEELSIRIQKALPETRIQTDIWFGDTVSLRIAYDGERYNPFRREADEDATDIAGLSLLRHRALRASYGYRKRTNRIHIVI